MGELVTVNLTVLEDKATHIVVCYKCREVVVQHGKGSSIRVTLSTAMSHQDLSLFDGHDFHTYNRRTKKMSNGVNLSSGREQ